MGGDAVGFTSPEPTEGGVKEKARAPRLLKQVILALYQFLNLQSSQAAILPEKPKPLGAIQWSNNFF